MLVLAIELIKITMEAFYPLKSPLAHTYCSTYQVLTICMVEVQYFLGNINFLCIIKFSFDLPVTNHLKEIAFVFRSVNGFDKAI